MARGAPWLVLMLLAAPLALADHTYSHRLVVEGRLLGSDGLPLPGRAVDVEMRIGDRRFAEDEYAPRCDEPPPPVGDPTQRSWDVTDEEGDFRFCLHAHDLVPSMIVIVRAGEVESFSTVDTDIRRMHFVLHDPSQPGLAGEAWDRQFQILGKVWEPGRQFLDGIWVEGVALEGVEVNVTLAADDGNGSVWTAVTDRYGDYDLSIQLNEGVDPTDVTLRLAALEARDESPLDAVSHVSFVTLRAPVAPPPPVVTQSPQPGGGSPEVSPFLLVFVVAGAGVVLLLRRLGSA